MEVAAVADVATPGAVQGVLPRTVRGSAAMRDVLADSAPEGPYRRAPAEHPHAEADAVFLARASPAADRA
ncbi:hypothetical protein DTL70_13270 [Streptomyces diacarni]|uniref:Uncharacterized protein n=1 Tax=Streptomyces diacarni TaxID=2800381 RepID=A0A367EZU1_9ACTN|nr:hypothetical protein DTL70_13270 [Streptomyces diacarni]